MDEYKEKYSLSTIIITTVVVIIILVLAFMFYYYSVQEAPLVDEGPAYIPPKIPVNSNEKLATPTNIIVFKTPDVLPISKESGSCWANSIAAPFRQDAWRCMTGNPIYDPCFETKQKGLVFCPTGPLKSEAILISLTKVLPKASVPQNLADNWAWFVKLKDGTYCSPFTGTRPFFSKDQVAFYGCNSTDKNQQIMLLGDLIKGTVWKANKAIVVKNVNDWVISSQQQVDVETIWQ